MYFFKKFKFLWRTTKVPREIFANAKEIWLTYQELDVVTKLLNFKIDDNEIRPNMTALAERAWVSLRTFQRVIKKLEQKELLTREQIRASDWSLGNNVFDLKWLFKKLDNSISQLYMNFYNWKIIWSEATNEKNISYFTVPKALDFFQKELDLTTKDVVFIKYLFAYIDKDFKSNVSLNYISKTSCMSRTTLTRAVKNLEKLWLLEISAKYHKLTKIRKKNSYNLLPLLERLNELERAKTESRVRAKWNWKDYATENAKRSHSVKNVVKIDVTETKENSSFDKAARIDQLENEIRNLQVSLTSKDSPEAQKIRLCQDELSMLKYWDSEKNAFSSILMERYKNLKSNKRSGDNETYAKARLICERLAWNWERSRNLYVKAVKLLPSTVDRFVELTLEKAQHKEKYFSRCMAKEFQNHNIL